MRGTLLAAIVVGGFDLAGAYAQAPAEPIQPAPLAAAASSAMPGRGTPHLGVNLTEVPYQGLIVRFVDARGPAEVAGLRAGDFLQTLNGQAVRTHYEFRDALGRAAAGAAVQLGVLRNGQAVAIGINPTQKTGLATNGLATPTGAIASAARPVSKNRGLGVNVNPVTPVTQAQLGLREARGAHVFNIYLGLPAHRAGIPLNAVITEFNDRPINTPADLSTAIAETEPTRQVSIKYVYMGQLVERYLQLDPVLDPYAVGQPTVAAMQPRFANNVSSTTVSSAPVAGNEPTQQALQRIEKQVEEIKFYLRSKDPTFGTGS